MKSKHLLLTLLLAILAPWAANAQETLTVHDGTGTNRYVPFYGYYADEAQTNQMIYPAAELGDMDGGTISGMTFYWTPGQYSGGSGVGTWTISIGETTATSLSGLDNTTAFTVVFTGGLDALFNSTDHILPIAFDSPYIYNGGNLIVQFSHQTVTSYKDYAFYGETVQGASYCYSSQRNFLPKTTFTYEAAASDCPKPDNFVASNVTAHTADLSWESDGFEFVLQYKKASDSNWTQKWPDANSYTLTGLAAETEYQVRVAAFHETCPTDPETGDHVHSDWRETSFTTGIACPAPTNLAVTPESITAREATVTWNGTSDSYVVMIGQENLAVSADFEDQTIPAAFTNSTSYPWTVTAGGANGSSYCAIPGNQGEDSSNSDLTLEVTLNNPATVSFNAKVSSENNYDWGRFFIDGTQMMQISGIQDWAAYSYELTAGTHTLIWRYAKDVSTASGNDLFYVDDIVVSAGVASWTEYNTNAQTYGFTNLTPNRHYQVKVKGNCGDEGYSQETTPVSFTTLPSCFAPTGLAMVAGYPTAHGASFTWDYQTGEVFQFALVQGNVTDPAEVNFNTTWNAGGNFPSWDNLSADTDWSFFLRKSCDGDFSDPVYVNFHTLEACPAPTGFAVMPNSITAHTANLTWQGTSNSYQVAYRTTAYVDGTEEGFSTNPTGWLFRTGVLNADGTATLSGNTSWSRSTGNGVFDTHIYMNMYSTKNNWLITPSMEIQNGDALSLDMAYTAYSGTQVAPAPNCPTHRFVILISTDDMQHWTILREWNNSGSEYVLDAIPTSGQNSGNIDLSAYAGQTAYIAFFGHSETSDYDNNFHFDNVAIGTLMPASEWQYMTEVTEVPCQLTGLLAERKYEATLQGDCENEGVSTVVGPITFTTGLACPAPTALTHANVKSNQVDLSWTTGGAEDWVVAYKKTADENFTEVNLGTDDVTIEGTTVTYTLTGLDEETAYTVKVRDNCEASFAGDGQSAWSSELSFTTMAACSVDNVTVSNITHCSATVNWNGESNNGFTVKYRTAAGIDGIEEGFSANPNGWLFRTGALNADGTATLSGNSSWSRGTSNGVFDTHLYMNMYTTKNHWLITPRMVIQNGDALSLDMAYTAYSGTQVDPALNSPAHRFAVLISTDDMQHWTILREWNNSGSEYVLDAIPPTGENSGNIDLSAYAGQTAYIAFFGHSETTSYDNNFHFDNVTIGTPVPAGTEQTVSATESPANLESLEIETKYEVMVVPNCDVTLASEWTSFTTLFGMTKEINAYDETNEKGWYLIASPLANAVNLGDVDGLTNGTFSLFRFNQNAELEWESYAGTNNPFTSLVNGKGYLYANNTGDDLTFIGMRYSGNGAVTVTYTENAEFAGWNLIGNPFSTDAYLVDANNEGLAYIRMNSDGNGFDEVANNAAIAPMEGIFYQATTNGTVYFSKTAPAGAKSGNLNMVVSQGRGTKDNAIIRFGEGNTMEKFSFREGSTKVYIPQNGKDYAVVNAENQGEMPVSFKAEKDGTYTMSFNAEEVTFNYLHLIDNMTGNDIDLLQTPSYTFNATVTDYENRFKLVFCTGSNDNSDNFAFCSNDNWIINNDGMATLQVVDMQGRIISSQAINGSASVKVNATAGVYVLRLINGENVRTQKVIVR